MYNQKVIQCTKNEITNPIIKNNLKKFKLDEFLKKNCKLKYLLK